MTEITNKIISQMRKWMLEYIILLTIEKGDYYVSDIIDILKKNKLIVVEWTLYPLLSRLKDSKIITYYWLESQSGPPRKYYKLTENGKEMLKIMHMGWDELSQAINNIKNLSHNK